MEGVSMSKSARKAIVAVEEPDSDEDEHHFDTTPPPSVIPEGPKPLINDNHTSDTYWAEANDDYKPGQSHTMAPLSPRGSKSYALPSNMLSRGSRVQSLGNFADLNHEAFHSERIITERIDGIGESGRSIGNTGNNSLDVSDSRRKGNGMLASQRDLALPAEEFALGCKLLQQAALGDQKQMESILKMRPKFVNFRDYDRRTALHVAASEGHLAICRFLVRKGAKINRSDRWGGSPLDDAHRHRHEDVVIFLREKGATTGSANNTTNLITAAADGDVDEVRMLLAIGNVDLNEGDYDRRTALHLAAGEGHVQVVELLCDSGANVNATDRWGFRPLDDARSSKHNSVIQILLRHGAEKGSNMTANNVMDDSSRRRERANLEVDFKEIDMIDRIGAGAFGEIYKCRWRGTLVAAKLVKSAKIRSEWMKTKAMEQIAAGGDVDDAIKEMDQAEMDENDKEAALNDFRQEVSILKSLRHPHIVLLLAYSTTENHEIMISELMKCSLLDVFKAHIVNGTKMKKQDQIVYATHLAQGMLYLHKCKPPIIHRDLKPANLLIDHSGVLKVSDFGLSKVRPDPKHEGPTDTYVMTGETGSYRFMAPEVYRREFYDETVDMYSYGMILFYLLDGRPPWPFENGLVAVKKAAEDGDRPEIPRFWDSRLQGLLQECWDENPKRRPSFDKVLKSLNEYSRAVFKSDSESKFTASIEQSSTARCSCTVM